MTVMLLMYHKIRSTCIRPAPAPCTPESFQIGGGGGCLLRTRSGVYAHVALSCNACMLHVYMYIIVYYHYAYSYSTNYHQHYKIEYACAYFRRYPKIQSQEDDWHIKFWQYWEYFGKVSICLAYMYMYIYFLRSSISSISEENKAPHTT